MTAEAIHAAIARREALAIADESSPARQSSIAAFLRSAEGRITSEVVVLPPFGMDDVFTNTDILASSPESLLIVPQRKARLVLRVDINTDRLPLELVGGVALKHPVARTFTDLPPRLLAHRKRRCGSTRILIATTRAPRPRLAGLDNEAGYLGRILGADAEARLWKAPDGNWGDVITSFHNIAENVDVIHFCGHTELDPDDNGGIWKFQLDGERDYWLHPREIGLLGIENTPGLIFFNTCGSEGGMEFAREAMNVGVRAFIQTAIPLMDSRGWELAANVYRRLSDGMEIGDAVLEARRITASRGSMLWAAVRLYGDPRWRMEKCIPTDSPDKINNRGY